MLFHALKANYLAEPTLKIKPYSNHLLIQGTSSELVSIARKVCLKSYSVNHIFFQHYVSKFIVDSNSDLLASIGKFMGNFNALKL